MVAAGTLRATQWRGDFGVAPKFELFFNMRRQCIIHLVYCRFPSEGWVKLNVDGACSGQGAGGGGVIRDSRGNFVQAFAEKLNCQTAIVAEILALYQGLQLCRQLGIYRVWIEMDALMVVKLVNNHIRGSWGLAIHLARVKDILRDMEFRITHIYREGNQVADRLALEGLMSTGLQVWSEMPSFLKGFIRVDKLRLPNLRLR